MCMCVFEVDCVFVCVNWQPQIVIHDIYFLPIIFEYTTPIVQLICHDTISIAKFFNAPLFLYHSQARPVAPSGNMEDGEWESTYCYIIKNNCMRVIKWQKFDKYNLMFDIVLDAHNEVKCFAILEHSILLPPFYYSSYLLLTSLSSFFPFLFVFFFLPHFILLYLIQLYCPSFSLTSFNTTSFFFKIPFITSFSRFFIPIHIIYSLLSSLLLLPLCRCYVHNGEFKIGRGWWRSSGRCECSAGCHAKRLSWRRH